MVRSVAPWPSIPIRLRRLLHRLTAVADPPNYSLSPPPVSTPAATRTYSTGSTTAMPPTSRTSSSAASPTSPSMPPTTSSTSAPEPSPTRSGPTPNATSVSRETTARGSMRRAVPSRCGGSPCCGSSAPAVSKSSQSSANGSARSKAETSRIAQRSNFPPGRFYHATPARSFL